MLEYEREKIKEIDDKRSKVELERGRIESENKVLAL